MKFEEALKIGKGTQRTQGPCYMQCFSWRRTNTTFYVADPENGWKTIYKIEDATLKLVMDSVYNSIYKSIFNKVY